MWCKKIFTSFAATHILSTNLEFKACGILFYEIPLLSLVLFLLTLEGVYNHYKTLSICLPVWRNHSQAQNVPWGTMPWFDFELFDMSICSLACISGFSTWHSHKHFNLLQSNALVSMNAHKEFALYTKNGVI